MLFAGRPSFLILWESSSCTSPPPALAFDFSPAFALGLAFLNQNSPDNAREGASCGRVSDSCTQRWQCWRFCPLKPIVKDAATLECQTSPRVTMGTLTVAAPSQKARGPDSGLPEDLETVSVLRRDQRRGCMSSCVFCSSPAGPAAVLCTSPALPLWPQWLRATLSCFGCFLGGGGCGSKLHPRRRGEGVFGCVKAALRSWTKCFWTQALSALSRASALLPFWPRRCCLL